MKWSVLLMLAACSPKHWRDDPSKPPAGVVAKLAIASGTHVRFLEISAHGIMSERDVDLGKYVTRLVWGSADPAVTLSDTDPHQPPFDAPTVASGSITADGFHAFPAYAWPPTESGEGVTELEGLVAHAGGTWEGHCPHALLADGRASCNQWTWVRQQPLPQVDSHDPLTDDKVATPALAAALPIAVDKRDKADYLKCTDGTRHVVTIPDAPEVSFLGMTPPHWLASEPPIFAASETYSGFDVVEHPHIYVDCREDGNLEKWVASDSGMVAIYGGRLDLVYRGKVIATSAGGSAVAFAPSASAPPAR